MTIELFSSKPIKSERIGELFQISFGQPFNKEYWEWRFLNNPNSSKTYIAYVEENEKLVGYYAVSPMQLAVKGEGEFPIALSNMTMTHPDYQGRGYFRKLAKFLYEELEKDGFIGVYGFANQNSHYGFRKYLGWNDLGTLFNFSLIKGNFRNDLLLSDVDVNIIECEVDKKNLAMLNFSGSESFDVASIRNDKVVNWRYTENPVNVYYNLKVSAGNEVVNIIYKRYNESIDIMDVFCDDRNQGNQLSLYAFEYLFAKNVEQINIWSNLYSDDHLMLEKIGFQNTNFSTYFGVILFNTKFKKILSIKNWYYSFFDSDVY